MILRLMVVLGIMSSVNLYGQEVDRMILDYYQMIQQEKYYEAMEFNYLAQGSDEDKAFIVSLMSSDNKSPGYGEMIKEIHLVKVGSIIDKNGKSFASAKVILSIQMSLNHLKTMDERKEEVEMMKWSFPDAKYDESTKSCVYKEHLNLICIKENGKWMLADERSYRLGLLQGVVDEEVWSKI